MKAQLILFDTPIIVSDEIAGFTYNKPTWNISGKIGFPENNQSRKIIAGLPELPSIDFNGFEEKFGIVDIEKLALIEYPEKMQKFPDWSVIDINRNERNIWINGFKAAQSLNEKRFSLEDMRKLASAAFTIKSNNETLIEDFDKWFDNRIKSLSQPKVLDIEVEREYLNPYGEWQSVLLPSEWQVNMKSRPKITNNQIKIIEVL